MKIWLMLAQYWANVADADNTETTLHECINFLGSVLSLLDNNNQSGVFITPHLSVIGQGNLYNNWFRLHYNVTFLHLCWD